MSKNQTSIGVAIIGLGAAGQQHWEALAACPGARVRAVVDPDPQACAKFVDLIPESMRPSITVAHDLEDALHVPRVDLVALCTPPGGRAELALAAIANGRAVLLEKPPVSSIDEWARVCDAANRADVAVGVMFQHRFRLPRSINESLWPGSSVGIVEMVRPRGPDHYRGSQWRLRSTDALGGVLAHLAIHQVDLCCQLLGVPHDMAGFMEAISEHTNVEFRAAIAVVFRSGAIATVIATSDPGRRRSRTAVMDGERQLLIDEEGTSLTADGTTIVAPAPRVPKLRASVYEDVISAMRAGEQPNIASLVSAEGAIRFLELSRTVRRI